MQKEKLTTIFTVGPDCGLNCAFCAEGNNKEFVLPIEPSDVTTLGDKLGKSDEIRFAGNAGDFFLQFNPKKAQELLKASVACLDGSATRTDRGYGRIQIITNGLFISKEHLEALLKYKDYITFVVSVDLGHHNGSKCKTKYHSLAELYKSGHQNECLYFNTITTSILLMQKMGFSLMINAVQRERESQQDLLKTLSGMLNIEEDHIWVGTAVQDRNIDGMPIEKTAKVRNCPEEVSMFVTKKLADSQLDPLLYLYLNFVSQREHKPTGYLRV